MSDPMDQSSGLKAMTDFWASKGWLGDPENMPQGGRQAGEAFGAAFQAMLQAQEAISQSLSMANQQPSQANSAGAGDPAASALLAKIFNPYAWFGGAAELDQSIDRVAKGPQLSDLWQSERKFAALAATWNALRKARAGHDLVMAEAWTRATGQFSSELSKRSGSLGSGREMMSLWTETANAILLETQRSEAFLKSQRDLLKASTDVQLKQQEILNEIAQHFGQPSRAEMDDVHKAVTELRREVRSLARNERARARAQSAAPDAGSARGR